MTEVFRKDFSAANKSVVTIGSFDGVHLGHRKILSRLKDAANAVGGETVVITFDPHPRRVLFPDDEPVSLLNTLEEKLALFESEGLDKVWVIDFTPEFSRISYQEFIVRYLVEQVKAHTVVVGYDHRFGKNRTGGLEELQKHARDYGFRVEEIPAYSIDDANVSSTKIRRALTEGNVALAAKFLGYEYPLTAKVVEGKKLGRTLGFPTANLLCNPEKLLPAVGVYAVWCGYDDLSHLPAIMNIGYRPTVAGTGLTAEVHLIGHEAALYGKTLTVRFAARLRDEQKFDSLEALKKQLERDATAALSALSGG